MLSRSKYIPGCLRVFKRWDHHWSLTTLDDDEALTGKWAAECRSALEAKICELYRSAVQQSSSVLPLLQTAGFGYKGYLDNPSWRQRTMLARFRLGAFPHIAAVRLRWHVDKPEHKYRLCRFCWGAAEDEIHLLTQCPENRHTGYLRRELMETLGDKQSTGAECAIVLANSKDRETQKRLAAFLRQLKAVDEEGILPMITLEEARYLESGETPE